MGYENLHVEREDGIAVVTVSRPAKLNALNGRTLDELDASFASLASDHGVKGVILTGAGEKAFVAGADIEELAGLDAEAGRALSERGHRVFDRIEWLGKPVIAAVNGFAEVKLGLICGYGGTQRLPRLVGRGAALEILLTGERVSAREALRVGLVNRVVGREELLAEARGLLRQMIANGPLALRATLEAVHGGADRPLGEAQESEAQLFGELCASQDAREGTRAFLEKRAPRFEGR